MAELPLAVSAVIVNYNAREHLAKCVNSLRREGVSQIVVVDNGSSDGSKEALETVDPGAVFLAQRHNSGYGAAANRGAEATEGEAVLICNPDVEMLPGALRTMIGSLAADTALGVVGPKILDREGNLYPSARTFPSLVDSIGHGFIGLVQPDNPFSRRYKMESWDHRNAQAVDWVSGACFLARREALDSVGGFDESYFMYMEDVDLCWRARR
ncbi:MAG: glycosyltransferase family 2 protein, partial [Acidimicrobiales bacterium]